MDLLKYSQFCKIGTKFTAFDKHPKRLSSTLWAASLMRNIVIAKK